MDETLRDGTPRPYHHRSPAGKTRRGGETDCACTRHRRETTTVWPFDPTIFVTRAVYDIQERFATRQGEERRGVKEEGVLVLGNSAMG